MPLNHLGLVLRFVDIRGPLPDAAGDPQVRGVVSWLTSDEIPDPQRYANWLDAMLAAGKHLVVLGSPGVRNVSYFVPRSFGKHPFDLHAEINGSIDYLNALLPAGKRVMLLQWSGDTHPFAAALDRVTLRREDGAR
jgi:hypothetical protein